MSTPAPDLQPLSMTVHATPSVQALSSQATMPPQRAGRWKMLAVLAVCAAPVVASYFTYYVVRPEGRRNFGTLIEPQRPMPTGVVLRSAEGETLPLEHLRGQWLLVSTAVGACPAQCEHYLYLQRQLRESVGREKERLDWVWLVNDAQAPASRLQPALRTAQVWHMEAAALQQWLQPAPGQQVSDHLYVVDPQGHAMLRFPADLTDADASKAKRDIERLLRASASWDRPGRPPASEAAAL